MTATATLQIKMIAAMLEAIDVDDEDDTKQAVAMIKALLVKGDAK